MIFTGLEVNHTYFRIWDVMTVETGFKKVWGKKPIKMEERIQRYLQAKIFSCSIPGAKKQSLAYGRCKITFAEKSKGHG